MLGFYLEKFLKAEITNLASLFYKAFGELRSTISKQME
jgi:hypothetical protein